jgi:arginase
MSFSDYLLGYASGIGSSDIRCAHGVAMLFEKSQYTQARLLEPIDAQDKYTIIGDICTKLATETKRCIEQQIFFHVVGGDHSSAIGTWSGAASGLRSQGALGLIWVDAHLDAHTPESSLSGNIHGMPLAALLGTGPSILTQILDKNPKLLPENVVMIGVRSFESSEQNFLNEQGVKIYYIDEVHTRGLDVVFQEARDLVTRHTRAYGITIDLDAIDPSEAPGVSTPEENGLWAEELKEVLKNYCLKDRKNQSLCGLEIAEYNPATDVNNRTQSLILELLEIL